MRIDKKLREKAFALRLAGYSYGKILKTLNLKSKGTLSLWLKDLVLTEKAKSLLKKNSQLAHDRGLFAFNRNRTKSIAFENKRYVKEGSKMINKMSQDSLFLIGIILYWAEGTKSEKSNAGLSFSNSDPAMIAYFIKFLIDFFNVNKNKLNAGIHLYPDSNITEARKYWSEITSIPKEKFYVITQLSISSQRKRPYNKLPHGTAVIRVSGRRYFYLMKGMIQGVKQGLINK